MPVLLAGCSNDPPIPEPGPSVSERRAAATTTLDALRQALADGDTAAAEALGADASARTWLRAVADNAAALRVQDLGLRYVEEDLAASATMAKGRWAGTVVARWRFDGADPSVAEAEVALTFAEAGDEVRLVGPGPVIAAAEAGSPAPGAAPTPTRRTPTWLAGPVRVHREAGLLVLVAAPGAHLDHYVTLARAAVPQVRSVLPEWRSELVVEVPASATAMDDALGQPRGQYAGIAAVTASVDGTHRPDSPVHVFVNHEVMGRIEGLGEGIVMTHEVAHLASGAVRAAAPLWLLEGFADYVALKDAGVPVSRAAAQVLAEVRDGKVPQALPGQAEFDVHDDHLGATYESAWLAARLLANLRGEARLVELYERTAAGEKLEPVMLELYGFGEEELTRRWRTELQTLARAQAA